jgi:hypothetical protein
MIEAPVDPPATEHMAAHVLALAKRHDVTLHPGLPNYKSAAAIPEHRMIFIPKDVVLPFLESSYAVLLHELGHIVVEDAYRREHKRTRPLTHKYTFMRKAGILVQQDFEHIIPQEELAWQRAQEQALTWTDAMQFKMDFSLATYWMVAANTPVHIDPIRAMAALEFVNEEEIRDHIWKRLRELPEEIAESKSA